MTRPTDRQTNPADGYREDLAYTHDVGFGGFARGAAPGLLAMLRQAALTSGRVIDLGCGSGIWARALADAGYDVLGIDISPAMVRLARTRVPEGEFRAASAFTAELPPCVAVTAMGECFNYLFDATNSGQALSRLFGRIYDALRPGGLLIFDVAGPGRVPAGGTATKHVEGDGWAVLVTVEGDRRKRSLTRRITTFRKAGQLYRRDHEVHRLRLYTRPELANRLRRTGFRARALSCYGSSPFPAGLIGFMARKPNEK